MQNAINTTGCGTMTTCFMPYLCEALPMKTIEDLFRYAKVMQGVDAKGGEGGGGGGGGGGQGQFFDEKK